MIKSARNHIEQIKKSESFQNNDNLYKIQLANSDNKVNKHVQISQKLLIKPLQVDQLGAQFEPIPSI